MPDYRFFNREISWIDFNNRVLEEGCDPSNPLLERIKFMAIFFSNLDEFFMVRISGLITQIKSGKPISDPSGYSPEKILDILNEKIKQSVKIAVDCVENELLKKLEEEGILIYNSLSLPENYREELSGLFMKKYFLILTPMAVDSSRPFPFISGKTSHLALTLEKQGKKSSLHAVIPLPANEPFIRIDSGSNKTELIRMGEFVKIFAGNFFEGHNILSSSVFRITRDAELNFNEEGAEDLLSTIREELRKRQKGFPVRLETDSDVDNELSEFLKKKIGYYGDFCYCYSGLYDASSFFAVSSLKGYPHLKDKKLVPAQSIHFSDQNESIFSIISKKNITLNLPFESFDPVVRLLREAAEDKNVLAIKQTLYRTSGDSLVIDALKKAADNGKQVTVLVELKARFDEEQNISWAKQLEDKGCHVIYGLVGLKTHCKMLLIVRDEEDGIKRYVHLSTGNYNDNTAKIYTDIGFFTSDNAFGRDASAIFNVLTGYSELPRWKKIVTAPAGMRNFFYEKISLEMENIKNGGKGKIIAKMNSLVDTDIIKKLYEASNAGVEINLIVRGMCCLVPGVKNQSENIKVTSIVDRFLEHSRVYYFYDSGNEEMYLSSADWMERNLDRRIEILYPVDDEENKKEIFAILKTYLNDNEKARHLKDDGTYKKTVLKKKEKRIRSQTEIYEHFASKKKIKKNQVYVPKMNPDETERLL